MTTNNEAFEKWHSSKYKNRDYRLTNYGYLHQTIQDDYEIWQAATTEANKRMAELESEVAELKERLDKHIAINKSLLLQRDGLQADNKRLREGVAIIKNSSDDLNTISQLQASNHDLREALEKIKRYSSASGHASYYHIADTALSATKKEDC